MTFTGVHQQNKYFCPKAPSLTILCATLLFTTRILKSTTLRGVPEGSAKLPHSYVMPMGNDGSVLFLLSLWQQAGMGKENTLMYSSLSLLSDENTHLHSEDYTARSSSVHLLKHDSIHFPGNCIFIEFMIKYKATPHYVKQTD